MFPARMLTAIALAVALALAGCTQKPATLVTVSGKVNFKGSALPDGIIIFSPDTSRG
jgi:hypothetical protein